MSRDPFYAHKFDANGEMRDGWSFERWIQLRVGHLPKTPSPVAEPSLRIPLDVRAEILRRLADGETKRALAEEHGITPDAIRYWLRMGHAA